MKFLMNNAKPQKLIIYQQKKVEYWTEAKKGKFIKYLIYIAMHPVGTRGGQLDKEDPIDQVVLKYNLPQNEKVIINHKSDNNNVASFEPRDFRYTSEQRRPVHYRFEVYHYPHIVNFTIGMDRTDERRYDLLVGEVVKVEDDNDAEYIMEKRHCVDEVNEKGEVIKVNSYPEKLGIDKEPMDTRGKQLPTRWEEVEWQNVHKRPKGAELNYSEETPA